MTSPVTPAAIIAAVKARGNFRTDGGELDLRDAAHEASHALEVELKGPWDRERIHAAVKRRGYGFMASSEIMARAVEQIVCREMGVEIEPVERWAYTACMEALKSGLDIGDIPTVTRAIEYVMKSGRAKAMAMRVMSLPVLEIPPLRPRRGRRKEKP